MSHNLLMQFLTFTLTVYTWAALFVIWGFMVALLVHAIKSLAIGTFRLLTRFQRS